MTRKREQSKQAWQATVGGPTSPPAEISLSFRTNQAASPWLRGVDPGHAIGIARANPLVARLTVVVEVLHVAL
jgi:hypothetical protein